MARKNKLINEAKVAEYAAALMPDDVIARLVDCDEKTLDKHCKKLIRRQKDLTRFALHKAQLDEALNKEKPNTTLLIWLGKQYLGQRDIVSAPEEIDKVVNVIIQTKNETNGEVSGDGKAKGTVGNGTGEGKA